MRYGRRDSATNHDPLSAYAATNHNHILTPAGAGGPIGGQPGQSTGSHPDRAPLLLQPGWTDPGHLLRRCHLKGGWCTNYLICCLPSTFAHSHSPTSLSLCLLVTVGPTGLCVCVSLSHSLALFLSLSLFFCLCVSLNLPFSLYVIFLLFMLLSQGFRQTVNLKPDIILVDESRTVKLGQVGRKFQQQ